MLFIALLLFTHLGRHGLLPNAADVAGDSDFQALKPLVVVRMAAGTEVNRELLRQPAELLNDVAVRALELKAQVLALPQSVLVLHGPVLLDHLFQFFTKPKGVLP